MGVGSRDVHDGINATVRESTSRDLDFLNRHTWAHT
jgi:hypothetical protein